jgi:endonuclease G
VQPSYPYVPGLLSRTMKKLIFSLFASLAASLTFAASLQDCPQHFAEGSPPEFVNQKMAARTRPLCFEGFAVMHSGVSRTPLWAAQHLTEERLVEARRVKRRNAFHEEERLPASERAELSDYRRSGFDRGHLSPAADMASEQSQYESFSLANIVPQDPNNNQNLWAAIEGATRSYTRSRGDVYVISGPLFEGSTLQRLKGRVLIPTHMFKAIYVPQRQQASAYITPNAPGTDYQVISIAELERRLGINLFPAMPEMVKQTRIDLPKPRVRKRNR